MNPSGRIDGPALAGIALALLTWASAFAAIAYALPSFTPGELALARLVIGSLGFTALLRWRGERLPPVREWPRLAALGVIGLTVYHLCLNWAETRIASGTAALVIALIPAATAALAALWMRERLRLRAWAGLAIALAGTVLVVLSTHQHITLDPLTGLLLLCVAAEAIMFVGQKPLFERYGALPPTTVMFHAATIAAIPFGWQLPAAIADAPAAQNLAALWLGVGPMFLGYLGWNHAIERASAARISGFLYLASPLALLISWLWLDEVPGAMVLLGGAIIIGGVILASWDAAVPAGARHPVAPAASSSAEDATMR